LPQIYSIIRYKNSGRIFFGQQKAPNPVLSVALYTSSNVCTLLFPSPRSNHLQLFVRRDVQGVSELFSGDQVVQDFGLFLNHGETFVFSFRVVSKQ
jgi:hypothetical protein